MYRIRMKWFLIMLIGPSLLSACATGKNIPAASPDPTVGSVLKLEDLGDRGAAPELENDVWLNVDAPLRLSGLKGKVVLLDFWTFG